MPRALLPANSYHEQRKSLLDVPLNDTLVLRVLIRFRQSRAGVPATLFFLVLAHLHGQVPLVAKFLNHVHLGFQEVHVILFILE